MSRVTAVLNSLKAENLLAGSYVLAQIDTLRTSLKYQTNGELVSFDDYYLRLQKEVDDIPRLELQGQVATGTENQYILQLIKGMEKVQDDSDRVSSKVFHYQSKLRNALSRIQRLSAAFNAWYTLAAGEAFEENSTKFPANQLKDLAASEFSRLMENMDVEVGSLLEAVKVQSEQLKQFKKTQQAKFELGKDQANASWTSGLPHFGEAPDRSDQLVARQFEEEEDDEVPAFVSKLPDLGVTHDKAPTFEEAVRDALADNRLAGLPAPSKEAVAAAVRQYEGTRPTLEDLQAENAIEDAKLPLGFIVDRADANEIKGTFFKRGDAKPITPTVNDEYTADSIEVLKGMDIDAAAPVIQPLPADPAPASLTAVFANAKEIVPEVKAAPVPKKVKTVKVQVAFALPTTENVVVRTDEDKFPEKIKCAICDRRIRVGQTMFTRDGEGWFHAIETDCTGAVPVVRGHKDQAVDPAPATQPLASAVAATSEALVTHTGPISQGTLLEVMEKAVATTGVVDLPPTTTPLETVADAPATPRKRLTFLEDDAEIV